MTQTELRPEVLVYYIDNRTGQTYVEVNGRIFELEIGDDITDEAAYLELEAMMVYDPETANEEPGTLRICGAE